MRTNDVLINGFEDIKILMQYLYMSEDHSIVIHNSIGVPLEFSLREDLICMCKNLNFPEIDAHKYNLTPDKLYDIVQVLKEEPAKEFPKTFENRWHEIKTITLSNVSLNCDKYDRYCKAEAQRENSYSEMEDAEKTEPDRAEEEIER